MNTQLTMPDLGKQKGAVITLEAMLLVLVGLVMAVSYAIILYDAITNYFVIWLNLVKQIFDVAAAAHLNRLCIDIQTVDPMILAPLGPDECFLLDNNGSTVNGLVNLIPSIETPNY